jgi:hypothetical protein
MPSRLERFLKQAMLGALVSIAPIALAAPAQAQAELQDGPKGLVIAYRTTTAKRPAFRTYLTGAMATKLRAMKAQGRIEGFEIYYSWYRQPTVWDAMIVLHFPTYASVTGWNMLEKTAPGGLDAAGLALAEPVMTSSVDLSWTKSAAPLTNGEVFYVIPYEYRDAGEYRDYVKAYVLPQFDGWMREGALSGYQLYMNRYSVGAPWDSLFIQRYRDFAAFGKRQQVLDKVRVTLRDNAEWQDWHKRKGGIRTETENSIAELIAH